MQVEEYTIIFVAYNFWIYFKQFYGLFFRLYLEVYNNLAVDGNQGRDVLVNDFLAVRAADNL